MWFQMLGCQARWKLESSLMARASRDCRANLDLELGIRCAWNDCVWNRTERPSPLCLCFKSLSMSKQLSSGQVLCDSKLVEQPWLTNFVQTNDKNLTTTRFGSNSKFILHQRLYYYTFFHQNDQTREQNWIIGPHKGPVGAHVASGNPLSRKELNDLASILVPSVLMLLGQLLIAGRDSGVLKKKVDFFDRLFTVKKLRTVNRRIQAEKISTPQSLSRRPPADQRTWGL